MCRIKYVVNCWLKCILSVHTGCCLPLYPITRLLTLHACLSQWHLKANWHTKMKTQPPWKLSQCIDSTSKPKFSRPITKSKTRSQCCRSAWVSEFNLANLHKDGLTLKCWPVFTQKWFAVMLQQLSVWKTNLHWVHSWGSPLLTF